MPHVVLTGGPGAGKTTVLSDLAAMGYSTIEDSARTVIAERLARGESRGPDLAAFAREILRRDIDKYPAQPQSSKWIFFDRGLIDALGLLQEVAPLPAHELQTILATYPFHPSVFVFPPWEAIYVNDLERDQSFADALVVYDKVVQWYRSCGYILHEVPRLSVRQRTQYILGVLEQRELTC